jgi:GMP synthase (glutamine-hydrolysing)
MALTIALLDASLGTDHAERNFRREIDADLAVYNVNRGEMPASLAPSGAGGADAPAPFDAAIITGSQSSVYDDRPWIAPLKERVRQGLAAGLPTLGVCWGHQLLAEVLGGRVEGGDYELGYVEVEQVHDDPIFEGIPDPFTVFATHSDHVVEMPPEATVLARNPVGVQAFRQGRAYATQFHPEYDLQTARSMIESKDLPASRLDTAHATCTDANVEAARAPKRLFDNFCAFAESVARASSPRPETR